MVTLHRAADFAVLLPVISDERPKAAKLSSPQVFFELAAAGSPIGKLVIQLESAKLPKTCDNFLALCTGKYSRKGNVLHYKGCPFHMINSESRILATGDVINKNGTGGHSIFGQFFDDEGESIGFGRPGTVAMLNFGPKRNNSQFFICLDANEDAFPGNLAFGYVVEGMDVLKKAMKYGTTQSGKPTEEVVIKECGESNLY